MIEKQIGSVRDLLSAPLSSIVAHSHPSQDGLSLILKGLIEQLEANRIFIIGGRDGNLPAYLARSNQNVIIHCVDTWEEEGDFLHFLGKCSDQSISSRIFPYRGFSVSRALKTAAIAAPIDLVWFCGEPEYSDLQNVITTISPLSLAGGFCHKSNTIPESVRKITETISLELIHDLGIWVCSGTGSHRPSQDAATTKITQPSELDYTIPPEIQNDEFYDAITSLMREEKLTHVLEIGSSSGTGSTRAFIDGLSSNVHGINLYCLEVSRVRFQELSTSLSPHKFVKCYNCSSVPVDAFPAEDALARFYSSTRTALNNYPLDRVIGWLRQDIEYIKRENVPSNGIDIIKHENNISFFDAVLIDGSEFTGAAELELVYGARFILLDDINGYKNYNNYQRLKSDPSYVLIKENWQLRNGYAIFKKAAKRHGTLLTAEWLGDSFEAKAHSSISVAPSTQFENAVRELFRTIRPKTIIETGSGLGRGTSSIIWRALSELGIEADFTTIEVNPEHHRQAVEYFRQNGMKINALLGLSLPRSLLPSPQEIDTKFVRSPELSGNYSDRPEGAGSQLYFGATNFDVSDNLLTAAMARYDYRPDFVLLDSDAQLSKAEFDLFLSLASAECFLMLYDIYDGKHFKNLQFLKQDSRFKILLEAEEKSGFCIAHFRPQIEVTEVKKKSYGSDQMRSEITFSQATLSAQYKTYTAGK